MLATVALIAAAGLPVTTEVTLETGVSAELGSSGAAVGTGASSSSRIRAEVVHVIVRAKQSIVLSGTLLGLGVSISGTFSE